MRIAGETAGGALCTILHGEAEKSLLNAVTSSQAAGRTSVPVQAIQADEIETSREEREDKASSVDCDLHPCRPISG